MKPLFCLKMCVKIDLRVIWTFLFLLGLPSIAQAHTVAENFNALNSFAHGFNHPFSGIDHLVGLLILGIGVGLMIDKIKTILPIVLLGCVLIGNNSSSATYWAGFLLATSVLLSLGIGLSRFIKPTIFKLPELAIPKLVAIKIKSLRKPFRKH